MKRTIVDISNLEMNDTLVAIKRVSKTVKGGRNMRFTALVVVGDGNGHVGAGMGKAAEIPEAIRKAKEDAMKKVVTVPMDENNSIPHDYIGKFGSATPAVLPVRLWKWLVSRTSVPSPWVPITSRT